MKRDATILLRKGKEAYADVVKKQSLFIKQEKDEDAEQWDRFTKMVKDFINVRVPYGWILVDHIAHIQRPEDFQLFAIDYKDEDKLIATDPFKVHFLLPDCTRISIKMRVVQGNCPQAIQWLGFGDHEYRGYRRYVVPDAEGNFEDGTLLFEVGTNYAYWLKSEDDYHFDWDRGSDGDWGVYTSSDSDYEYTEGVFMAVGLAQAEYAKAYATKDRVKAKYEKDRAEINLRHTNRMAVKGIKEVFDTHCRITMGNRLEGDPQTLVPYPEARLELLLARLIIAVDESGHTPY